MTNSKYEFSRARESTNSGVRAALSRLGSINNELSIPIRALNTPRFRKSKAEIPKCLLSLVAMCVTVLFDLMQRQ